MSDFLPVLRSRAQKPVKHIALALLMAFAVPLSAPAALAQSHGGGHGGRGGGGGWHGGGGGWHGGGWHGGGWYRGVGVGFWAPLGWGWPAPYEYYYPPAYYAAPYAAAAPVVVQQQPAPAMAAAPAAATGMWYYCDNPRGYYPYVPNCGSAWQQVPATPPPNSAPAQQ